MNEPNEILTWKEAYHAFADGYDIKKQDPFGVWSKAQPPFVGKTTYCKLIPVPTPHPNAKFLRAFADGKKVQWLTNSGVWRECRNPDFALPAHRYRIVEPVYYRRYLAKNKHHDGLVVHIMNKDVDPNPCGLACFVKWIDNDWIVEENC